MIARLKVALSAWFEDRHAWADRMVSRDLEAAERATAGV